MALPVSRNRTYAIGDPIASADLNDLQDQILRLEAIRARVRTEHVSGGAGFSSGGGGVLPNGRGGMQITGLTGSARYNVPLSAGKRLHAIRARVNLPANTVIQSGFWTRTDGDPAPSGTVVSSGSGIQTLPLLFANPFNLVAGTSYYLEVFVNSGPSCEVIRVEFDYDELL